MQFFRVPRPGLGLLGLLGLLSWTSAHRGGDAKTTRLLETTHGIFVPYQEGVPGLPGTGPSRRGNTSLSSAVAMDISAAGEATLEQSSTDEDVSFLQDRKTHTARGKVQADCWPEPVSVYHASVKKTLCLGNALSEYLEGLAKATLANVPFQSLGHSEFRTFLKYLPETLPAPRPQGVSWVDSIRSACLRCHGHEVSPHECRSAWADPRVADVLRGAIHTALRAQGLQRVQEEFLEGEVVVHLRCAADTLLSHSMYGPPGFSLFDSIPKNAPRVTFVEGPSRTGECLQLREAAKARVRERLPNTTVRVSSGVDGPSSTSADFARLAFAPVLVRGVSSFSLWAAFANPNKVISVRNPDTWGWDEIDFGPNWHWVDAPVLSPKVAEKEFGIVSLSRDTMENLVVRRKNLTQCWPLPETTVTVTIPARWHLGNALSLYLEGLAKASLGNLPFEWLGRAFFENLMRGLPDKFPAPRPEGPSWAEAVRSYCQRCHWYQDFPHECPGAWTDSRVFGILRGAIHSALKAHGLHKVQEQFVDGEAVVHLRCADDTLLSHHMYGPPAFSIFDDIPKNTTRVTFVEGPIPQNCIALRDAAVERVKTLLPNAEVRVLTGGRHPDSVSEDFARLAYAPVLVRSVSTFSLWAAYANQNKVISPLNPDTWGWDKLDFGENWQWSNAPVLVPKVARQAFGQNVSVSEETLKNLIIPWLQKH